MTSTPSPEPLEALPMPDGAIELVGIPEGLSSRQLVVAALQQALAERRLSLPLGPETARDQEDRLLNLNRFSLQLASAGIGADQIAIDRMPWLEAATAPQLLLTALVDEENGVVAFPGVLTGPEFVELTRQAGQGTASNGEPVLLEADSFRGGIARLFTLVQLLEPEALPQVALAPAVALGHRVVRIADWLRGQVDDALAELFGAQWQPITQGAFRSGARGSGLPPASGFTLGITAAVQPPLDGPEPSPTDEPGALALVSIPLGLKGSQLVCCGDLEGCLELFVLQMVAIGAQPGRPDGLVLQLLGVMRGDLLPDGLELRARQGSLEQIQVAEASTGLRLLFSGGSELISVTLRHPGGEDLVLPPLQLPG